MAEAIRCTDPPEESCSDAGCPVHGGDAPSYHDLHITTSEIPRTSIFNLPYGLEVHCSRVSGWQLWNMNRTQPAAYPLPPSRGVLLAGEYEGTGKWLMLDVDGHVIVNSRDEREQDTDG